MANYKAVRVSIEQSAASPAARKARYKDDDRLCRQPGPGDTREDGSQELQSSVNMLHDAMYEGIKTDADALKAIVRIISIYGEAERLYQQELFKEQSLGSSPPSRQEVPTVIGYLSQEQAEFYDR